MSIGVMNWIIVAILSCCGLVMGILAVNGYTQKIEPFLWLLFAGVAILVITRNVDSEVFLHGLCIGIIWGVLNGLTQCAFFDSYIANNPGVRDSFDKMIFMPLRFFPLFTGPVIGTAVGLVLGGLCFAVKKIMG